MCEQTKSDDGVQQRSSGPSKEILKEIEEVKVDIAKLKARKQELLIAKESGGPVSETVEAEDGSDEDGSDDEVDIPLGPPPGFNPGQRASVSAEAYGTWNKKEAFVPPRYEKTPEQTERIRKVLAGSFLFSSLDDAELEIVILAMKEKVIESGVRIIQEGDDGNALFVIEEGKVDCMKKIDGEEKVVKTCTPGDAFGELALLYNCPRAASVQSTERAVLWELDRESFNSIVKEAAANKRNMYMDTLKRIPIFANMEEYEMMTIADALKMHAFEENTTILHQGDPGNDFFLVAEGECVAKKAFVDGQEPKVVHTHKAGDYFGELALLQNEPRAASIVAVSPTVKLLSMDRKTFNRLLGPIQDILRREAKRYKGIAA